MLLSPCLFNFYAEYIMRNAGLEEAQAGIKIAGRDIKGIFHAKMSTIKDRNGMDLTEAEEIKKRWQEYTE